MKMMRTGSILYDLMLLLHPQKISANNYTVDSNLGLPWELLITVTLLPPEALDSRTDLSGLSWWEILDSEGDIVEEWLDSWLDMNCCPIVAYSTAISWRPILGRLAISWSWCWCSWWSCSCCSWFRLLLKDNSVYCKDSGSIINLWLWYIWSV